MNQEDIELFLVEYLKDGAPTEYTHYGYDLYLPAVMRTYIHRHQELLENTRELHAIERMLPSISNVFYAAAWELCRRGIIRPGVRKYGEQHTDDGNAGNGFSITPYGKNWVDGNEHHFYLPTEPGRFSQMLADYESILGEGCMQRATEAIKAYGANLYLACCTMCGAAVESVMLKLTIEKVGDADKVLSSYNRAGGRRYIEGQILNHLPGILKNEFQSFFNLLKYWRDNASHGQFVKISENEAYSSLALVLRCAQFVNDNKSKIVS